MQKNCYCLLLNRRRPIITRRAVATVVLTRRMLGWSFSRLILPSAHTLPGDAYGRYIPQSVLNKDGQPLDIDIVVNEIFGDGDELYVEFSDGPQAYRVR